MKFMIEIKIICDDQKECYFICLRVINWSTHFWFHRVHLRQGNGPSRTTVNIKTSPLTINSFGLPFYNRKHNEIETIKISKISQKKRRDAAKRENEIENNIYVSTPKNKKEKKKRCSIATDGVELPIENDSMINVDDDGAPRLSLRQFHCSRLSNRFEFLELITFLSVIRGNTKFLSNIFRFIHSFARFIVFSVFTSISRSEKRVEESTLFHLFYLRSLVPVFLSSLLERWPPNCFVYGESNDEIAKWLYFSSFFSSLVCHAKVNLLLQLNRWTKKERRKK